jgi:hypothetical protein
MNKNGRTNALNSQFSTSKKKKFDKNNSLIHQSKNRSCVNQKFYQKILTKWYPEYNIQVKNIERLDETIFLEVKMKYLKQNEILKISENISFFLSEDIIIYNG